MGKIIIEIAEEVAFAFSLLFVFFLLIFVQNMTQSVKETNIMKNNLTQIINEMIENDKQYLKIALQSQTSTKTERDNIRNLLNKFCEKINNAGTEPSLNFDLEIYKKFQQQFETKNYTFVIGNSGEMWLCFE